MNKVETIQLKLRLNELLFQLLLIISNLLKILYIDIILFYKVLSFKAYKNANINCIFIDAY